MPLSNGVFRFWKVAAARNFRSAGPLTSRPKGKGFPFLKKEPTQLIPSEQWCWYRWWWVWSWLWLCTASGMASRTPPKSLSRPQTLRRSTLSPLLPSVLERLRRLENQASAQGEGLIYLSKMENNMTTFFVDDRYGGSGRNKALLCCFSWQYGEHVGSLEPPFHRDRTTCCASWIEWYHSAVLLVIEGIGVGGCKAFFPRRACRSQI